MGEKLPRRGLLQQRFNRNFFLDKSLWTTIFPDKLLLQGFIRNFFRHNNHCTWLVGGLSGISGQTSTGCLKYSLVPRQSIVCSFSPALDANFVFDDSPSSSIASAILLRQSVAEHAFQRCLTTLRRQAPACAM
jgi:hypothetical protein